MDRDKVLHIDCEDTIDSGKHWGRIGFGEVYEVIFKHTFECFKLSRGHGFNDELTIVAEEKETPRFALGFSGVLDGLEVYFRV